MAIKNQSITIQFTAWDTAANAGKIGDSANFTLRIIQDGSATTLTNSVSEVDATNCPGIYKVTLTAGEMNYNTVSLAGKSSTTGIIIVPVHIITECGVIAKSGDKMDIVDAPSSTGTNALVDAFLTRAFGSVSYTGTTRCVLTALQKLRNKVANSGGTQTVYKENDSTASYTSTITTDAAADPVVSIDPDS